MRVLVAGVGNVLRGDDGFGVAVAQGMRTRTYPGAEVEIFEAGIAGIPLVQELMNGFDALIIADALERGGPPGTLYIIEPDVPDLDEKHSHHLSRALIDAHYSDPSKVLILAKALSVLPRKIFLIGCEPAGYDELGADLSAPVRRAVEMALTKIDSLIADVSNQIRAAP